MRTGMSAGLRGLPATVAPRFSKLMKTQESPALSGRISRVPIRFGVEASTSCQTAISNSICPPLFRQSPVPVCWRLPRQTHRRPSGRWTYKKDMHIELTEYQAFIQVCPGSKVSLSLNGKGRRVRFAVITSPPPLGPIYTKKEGLGLSGSRTVCSGELCPWRVLRSIHTALSH